jgi:hypothetical protein
MTIQEVIDELVGILNHPDADLDLGYEPCLLNIEGRWTRIREITPPVYAENGGIAEPLMIHSED